MQPSVSIDSDILCTQCGYNLRTLNESTLCPECALPVRQSIAAHHLDLPRLKKLAFAARLISISMAIGTCFMFYAFATFFPGRFGAWWYWLVTILTQCVIHGLRFAAVYRIASTQLPTIKLHRAACLIFAGIAGLAWMALFTLPMLSFSDFVMFLVVVAMFACEGALTLAASRFLRRDIAELRACNIANLRTKMLPLVGYLLFLAPVLTMISVVVTEPPLTTLARLAVTAIFLFSRLIHALFWSAIFDLGPAVQSRGKPA
jgi:hypothetical protein